MPSDGPFVEEREARLLAEVWKREDEAEAELGCEGWGI